MHWWKSQKIKHNTENLNSILLCSSKASSELNMSVFLIYYGNAPREECEGAVKIRGKEAKQGCSLSPGSTENSFSLIPRWASEVWVMLQSHFSWLGVRVGLCFHIPTAVSYWLRVNWSGFGIPDTLVALHRWAKWLQQPEDSPLRKSFSCWSGGSDSALSMRSLAGNWNAASSRCRPRQIILVYVLQTFRILLHPVWIKILTTLLTCVCVDLKFYSCKS